MAAERRRDRRLLESTSVPLGNREFMVRGRSLLRGCAAIPAWRCGKLAKPIPLPLWTESFGNHCKRRRKNGLSTAPQLGGSRPGRFGTLVAKVGNHGTVALGQEGSISTSHDGCVTRSIASKSRRQRASFRFGGLFALAAVRTGSWSECVPRPGSFFFALATQPHGNLPHRHGATCWRRSVACSQRRVLLNVIANNRGVRHQHVLIAIGHG